MRLRAGTPALRIAGIAVSILNVAGIGAALADQDAGQRHEQDLRTHARQDFGVGRPLDQSSGITISQEQARSEPEALFTLADGLKARIVTTGVAAPNIDMMALWPDDQNPTHLIACNEGGTDEPGLQRINLRTGAVETILTGTSDCGPVRRTPWGTIMFAEEAGGGPNGGVRAGPAA